MDSLVSQLPEVNLSSYKVIENKWAKALEPPNPKKVTVDVRVVNDPVTGRPIRFEAKWTIDGKPFRDEISNI